MAVHILELPVELYGLFDCIRIYNTDCGSEYSMTAKEHPSTGTGERLGANEGQRSRVI